MFILGLTFVGCLLLAIAIGLTRGESAFQVSQTSSNQIATEKYLGKPSHLEISPLSNKQIVKTDFPKIP
ncbi:MAG: hypothetical protein U7123_03150 [Potamolinea sp.]